MSSSAQSPREKQGSPSRKRSQQLQDERATCLYIGNIDKKVDNDQLKDIFQKYGELQYCYIVYEPSSTSDRGTKKEQKISRGYGFAKFVKYEDLMKAKTQLDGRQINGRSIKVELSKRNKPRDSTPGRYLGKKKYSPPRHGRRDRSYSRESSDSYYHRRRNHQRKEKHRRSRRERSRDSRDRSRSRDRSQQYRERRHKRSYSKDRERSRKQKNRE